jgi:hypothetical protein
VSTGSAPPRPTSIGGEPLDPEVDLVRLAARGLTMAALAGIGSATVVLALVRLLVADAAPSDVPDTGPAFYLLTFGMLAAMGLAAGIAWRQLRRLSSPFRRGVFAMIAAFATFVGALLATPVHFHLGLAGLLGLGALSIALAVLLRPR